VEWDGLSDNFGKIARGGQLAGITVVASSFEAII
jgi:hypothetical protein